MRKVRGGFENCITLNEYLLFEVLFSKRELRFQLLNEGH